MAQYRTLWWIGRVAAWLVVVALFLAFAALIGCSAAGHKQVMEMAREGRDMAVESGLQYDLTVGDLATWQVVNGFQMGVPGSRLRLSGAFGDEADVVRELLDMNRELILYIVKEPRNVPTSQPAEQPGADDGDGDGDGGVLGESE